MNWLISPLYLVCNPPTRAQTACRSGQELDQTFFIQNQFAKINMAAEMCPPTLTRKPSYRKIQAMSPTVFNMMQKG